MPLSFQTTCIIFAVTMVHLLLIAAISPLPVSALPMDFGTSETPREVPAAFHEELAVESDRPGEIVDLPAVRRETTPLSDNATPAGLRP